MKFYYQRKIKPVDSVHLKYYHYQLGIAGFNQPQKGHLLFHGTDEGFKDWLNKRQRTSKAIGRTVSQQLF